LIAYGSLTSREINTALAYEVLGEAFTTGCVITLESITTAVCAHFKVQVDQLKSKRKTADLVRARQVAMYLCRKHTAASLKTIGDEFGGRDHSTVIHSISAIDGNLKNDLNLKTSIETVENRLKA
jgi:chromosomal replication initiator protein